MLAPFKFHQKNVVEKCSSFHDHFSRIRRFNSIYVTLQPKNEGSFDFAFVDADKFNYWNYHERMMKLVKVGGIIIYDNTLWGGYVALPEEDVPEKKRAGRQSTIEFNNSISADPRVEISHASVGDGVLICRRIC